MGTLTPELKQHKFIQQALDVQTALSTNNYHALFQLFSNAYNMGGYILDHLLERERVAAMVIMTKAYVSPPSDRGMRLSPIRSRYKQLPISFITTELAFDTASSTVQFLHQVNASHFLTSTMLQGPTGPPDEHKVLDCKPAHAPLAEWMATKYAKVGIKGRI